MSPPFLVTAGPTLGLAGVVPAVALGAAASITFSAYGVVGLARITVLSEDLPAEWSFADNGDGTATLTTSETLEAGDFTITLRVVDANRQPVVRTFTVEVYSIPEPAPTDPYFSDVVMLLHFNGTDGSTTITDSSAVGESFSAFNGARLSTADPKFGTASLAPRYTGSDGYVESATANAAYALGTDSWTFDCWVEVDSWATSTLQTLFNVGSFVSGVMIRIRDNLYEVFRLGSTILSTGTDPVATGEKTHIEVGYDSATTTMYLFKNGTLLTSASVGSSSIPAGKIMIGASQHNSTECINGRIDDARLTVGTCRHTAGFTAPTYQAPDS